MKISTKGRYALRFMLDVALAGEGACLSIHQVSKDQGISEKYLEQIVPSLLKHDFLLSVRGAHGGYKLARQQQDYTVGEILRAVEGDLVPVACLACGADPCERAEQCATLEVWKEMQQAIDEVVNNITLEKLRDIQIEKLCDAQQIF